jgi:lipoprotein signal peptidase
MSERSYRGLLWGLALAGLLLDQSSKYLVFHRLYNGGQGGEHTLVPGAFDLLAQFTGQRAQPDHPLSPLQTWSGDILPRVNPGALFGIQVGMGVSANTLFAIISMLAALAIIYWSTYRSLAKDRILSAALGLILAGTLGNLYDRVVFHGVRDFLYVHYLFEWPVHYDFQWPVFNIADCCLVLGAFLLLAQAFFSKHEQPVAVPVEEAVVETTA